MRLWINLLVFLIIICGSVNIGFSKNIGSFGKAFTVKKKNKLSNIISHYKLFKNKTVLVGGTVRKVCVKMGCWMNLSDGKQEVRVTFKDYGFFVPKKILNKKVEVEGVLLKKIEKESQTRHYLEDEGKSKKEIQKIVGDRIVYHFVANGVKTVK